MSPYREYPQGIPAVVAEPSGLRRTLGFRLNNQVLAQEWYTPPAHPAYEIASHAIRRKDPPKAPWITTRNSRCETRGCPGLSCIANTSFNRSLRTAHHANALREPRRRPCTVAWSTGRCLTPFRSSGPTRNRFSYVGFH